MRIRVGDYTLMSDGKCYWITEERIAKSGKVRQENITGYCKTVDDLTATFINKRLCGSGARDFTTALEILKESVQEAKKMIAEVKLDDTI